MDTTTQLRRMANDPAYARKRFARLMSRASAAMRERLRLREDELARRQNIARILHDNPVYVTFVFEEGDCDPPYYTRHVWVVQTPRLQEFLAWERNHMENGGDACLVAIRKTTLADWQRSGSLSPEPLTAAIR